MNATKILWGQVLVVSIVVLAFIWAATEWTAWRLGFQPQLGHAWFVLFGWPVYQPPAFFWWWFAYDRYAPDVFIEGAYIAASGGIAAIVVAFAISSKPAREFELADDEPDDDAQRLLAIQRVRTIARQAALDPGDGMEL